MGHRRGAGRGAGNAALAAVALGFLFLYGVVGDRTWWGEWVAVWPPVGWLVLFLPIALRRRAWVALGSFAVLAVAYADGWPSRPSETAAGPALRVAIWNVAGNPETWRSLEELRPDLVLVQESAGPPPVEWPGYTWFGGFDAATLTRLPAESLPTRKVGPWVEPNLIRLALPGGGAAVVANVRLVLPSIVTWVASGFDGSPRAGYEARAAQFPALAALVREAMAETGAAEALVAGDFNAPARMASLEPLRAFLADAWTRGGRGWGGTATADLPVARIDQCWVSAGLIVASARVLRRPDSDHRLLLVDLRVREAVEP